MTRDDSRMYSRPGKTQGAFRRLWVLSLLVWTLMGGAAFGQIISTVAGGYIGDGNDATLANLSEPADVFQDGAGNTYIADTRNNRVRKVDASGNITTVAGGGTVGWPTLGDGGQATAATLSSPASLFVDGSGNLYIADSGYGRIRKVTLSSGVITTVAGGGPYGSLGDGGPATAAYLAPTGVCVDASGNIYISDIFSNRIRKVDAVSGLISTVAGSGPTGWGSGGFSGDGGAATSALLNQPTGVSVDAAGNIYIADTQNNRIRKVDTSGAISTVAGGGAAGWPSFGDGGLATDASIYSPQDVFTDGGNLYIAEGGYSRIRKVTAGNISTVAGNGTSGFSGDGGPATSANLLFPRGVYVDGAGNITVADTGNDRIRRVDAGSGNITTVAGGYIGDGSPATQANLKILNGRQDIFVDVAGNLYIPDSGHNRVRKVSPSGVITTVAGGGAAGWPTLGDGGAATGASLNTPTSVFVDGSGNLYIADANNQRVRMVDPSGVITTVAGGSGWGFSGDGGPATSAQLSYVTGICLDASGNLYIADNQNHRIRRVDAATKTITTVAGNGVPGYSGDGGTATAASLNSPTGVSVDASGNLYIVDTQNNRIRKVNTSGVISTVAGGGAAGWPTFGDGGPATGASLSYPQGVFADGGGNLYIAESSYSRVRKVNASGIISTVAGNNNWGFSGDGGLATSAQLASPTGVFRSASGALYIADSGNNRVRKVSPPSTVIQLTANPTQITTGSDASTIQAKLLDQSGALKTGDNSTVITFSLTAGVGSLSATTVTVTGGVATVSLTSSTVGTVTVQASAYDAEGASVSVVVAAPARQIALTASPTAIVADGVSASTIQAQIQDLAGVLQSGDNATVVTFEATPNVVTGGAGSLSATTVTVTGGVATTTLTGSLPGIVDVKASALGAQSRTVSVTLKASAPPPGEPPPPGEVGPGQITTVAGGYLGDGNPATQASLSIPQGVSVDAAGNLYIADASNNRIRRVDPSGVITTVAGGGAVGWPTLGDGGPATSATLSSPSGVFADGAGNLYIADSGYGRIRKVDASGNITTVAGGNYGALGDGGLATDASLNPRGVVADGAGNLYIADSQNHRIRRVDAATKIITTVAGNGTQGSSGDGGQATNASLYYPQGVSLDGAGALYIADTQNNRIRRVNLSSGVISTVAGGGTAGWPAFGDGGQATGATLNYPSGVFADGSGLYIAEGGYSRIRKVDVSGIITTVAGNGMQGVSGDGGPATAAQLNFPAGVFKDASGNLYIADTNNDRIRKVNTSGVISTVAGGYIGDGSPATSASLKLQNWTPGLFVDGSGNLYIPDPGHNRVRRVNTAGVIATVAGGGAAGWPTFGDGGAATSASVYSPQGVFMDGSGNLYVSESGYSRIRKVNPSGVISTVAGGGPYGSLGDGGPATGATLNYPSGIFVDASGALYIADSNNHRVRKVNPSGVISTVAGNGTPGSSGDGGPATGATLNYPTGVFVDAPGNLYIATNNDGRVRKVDATTGVISTVAGGGTAGWPTLGDGGPATNATLSYPTGVYVDKAGALYIADRFNHRVRKVDTSGIITTVAGGTYGFSGDGGLATAAAMSAPSGLFMDGSGNLYIADSGNNRVRKANLSAPTAATPTGTNVSTQLTDPVTGESPATLTFSNVTQAGETTLTQSTSGPPPPSGFELGGASIYFDISTTAVFSGPVDLCVAYSDADVTDEANLKLFHYEGGAWADVTTSLDTVNNVLCGQVTSFSPFAVFVARKKELKVSALTGAQRVEIGKAANVTGDLLSGGEVQVQEGDDKRPGLIAGSIRAVGDARIGRNNRITGNVTLGGQLLLPEKKQASTVVIDGAVAEHAQVDPVRLPPVVLSVDPKGAGKLKVKQKESIDLPPNSASNPAYGSLDADHHATVTLRSGTYYFDKFVMKHDAKLVIQIDRGAPITVNVQQGIQMGHHSGVTIRGGDASHVLFNIGGAGILPEADEDDEPPPKEKPTPASRIQHHAQFAGTLYSPQGELRLEHNAVVEGALIGREVRTDQEVRFTGKVASHLDLSGRSVLAKPALTDEALTFGVDQNYPNPFNPVTTIRYTLPEASDVRLVIYNILGQQVRVLVNAKQMPGVYSVSWDSRDAYGRSVASGLYFYRLQAGPHVAVRKMLLMK